MKVKIAAFLTVTGRSIDRVRRDGTPISFKDEFVSLAVDAQGHIYQHNEESDTYTLAGYDGLAEELPETYRWIEVVDDFSPDAEVTLEECLKTPPP
jgi:hypothetical protein